MASTSAFRLSRGELIADAVERWARLSGWTLDQPDMSWVSPADTQFEGDFAKALSALVTMMVRQGAPIQLHLWPINRSALIVRTTP